MVNPLERGILWPWAHKNSQANHHKWIKKNQRSMRLVDTHTHLYVAQFDEDRRAVVERALSLGIDRLYLPNIDQHSIAALLALEEAYPQHCRAMMGLHPCSVGADYLDQLRIIKAWLDKRRFAAVGEIGMDLYWDKTYRKEQEDAFLQQVEWALAFDLPIVIHSRETIDLLIDLVRSVHQPNLRGIFHCFTGTKAQGEAIIDLGFYLGIGGVLTFKNAGVDQVVGQLPLDRMVLETDSPYLAPAPHRGKRNESSYLLVIAEKLAQVHGVPLAEVAEMTTRNAKAVFEPEV